MLYLQWWFIWLQACHVDVCAISAWTWAGNSHRNVLSIKFSHLLNGMNEKKPQGLCTAQFQQFSAIQFVLNVLGFLIYDIVNTGTQWFMAQRKTSVFVEKIIEYIIEKMFWICTLFFSWMKAKLLYINRAWHFSLGMILPIATPLNSLLMTEGKPSINQSWVFSFCYFWSLKQFLFLFTVYQIAQSLLKLYSHSHFIYFSSSLLRLFQNHIFLCHVKLFSLQRLQNVKNPHWR